MRKSNSASEKMQKQVQKFVETFNKEYSDLVAKFGDEYLLLDTSAGSESWFKVSPLTIVGNRIKFTIEYSRSKKMVEDFEYREYCKESKEWYFTSYYDDTKWYLNSCLRKGKKHLETYSSDIEDNEETYNQYINNL